ncbi:homoserine dehydrogenase [Chrysochromulina tobinii]|uniref:Homoserine dehydrogenase n=1 Tax=Chrysochromulina tobinii TaxID=1460289 RepID=A0A0M0LR28_9EUKA|nr:homoserine dehydrogenase [Chrysochromulina tobinii]|eukprot:KOO53505.1 homoserine dehydrogenase [Chrysochromulina sp. CCMP291]
MASGKPKTVHITLIGFGSVNRALARLIAQEAARLEQEHKLRVVYHAVVARHGAWDASESPLSAAAVATLADAVAAGCARLDGSTHVPAGVKAVSEPTQAAIRAIIGRMPVCAEAGARSAIVEAIDVDYSAGEPAATYIRDALTRGCHAVSANKGPVVHHRDALLALASEHGVRYLHESAVMDGVPIFSTWRAGFLPGGAKLRRFRGALNSTTSVILSGMERGQSMQEALKTAQDAGIAEADPTGDTSGMDAAVKVVALALALDLHRSPSTSFDLPRSGGGGEHQAPFALSDVDVSGIEGVTPAAVASALAAGKKLRLVAGAEAASEAEGGRARGYVRVEALEPSDVLYGLNGADAAVTFYTDRLAPVTIMQHGSVVEDTAFGEYADLMRALRPVEA